jgi:hypothetical protein
MLLTGLAVSDPSGDAGLDALTAGPTVNPDPLPEEETLGRTVALGGTSDSAAVCTRYVPSPATAVSKVASKNNAQTIVTYNTKG